MLQGLCVCDLLSGGAGHSLQNDVGILNTPQEDPQGCHLKSHLEVSPTQPSAACFRSHLQSIDLVKIQTHAEFSFYLFIEQYIKFIKQLHRGQFPALEACTTNAEQVASYHVYE